MKRVADFKEDIFYRWRPMTKADVRYYFKNLSRASKQVKDPITGKIKSIAYFRKSGEYCERCGIGIGKGYSNQEFHIWQGFNLCFECYKSKIDNLGENTPDLEDLLKLKN